MQQCGWNLLDSNFEQLLVRYDSPRGSSADTNSRYTLLCRRRVRVAATNKINGRFRVSDTSKIYSRSGVPHTLVLYHGGFRYFRGNDVYMMACDSRPIVMIMSPILFCDFYGRLRS